MSSGIPYTFFITHNVPFLFFTKVSVIVCSILMHSLLTTDTQYR